MTTVQVDREKVLRMVAETLQNLNGTGAHPGEMVLALGESLGRIIVAVKEIGGTEVVQKELLDLAIKQMTNAIIAARQQEGFTLILPGQEKPFH